jgi:hypothetical protein
MTDFKDKLHKAYADYKNILEDDYDDFKPKEETFNKIGIALQPVPDAKSDKIRIALQPSYKYPEHNSLKPESYVDLATTLVSQDDPIKEKKKQDENKKLWEEFKKTHPHVSPRYDENKSPREDPNKKEIPLDDDTDFLDEFKPVKI